MKTKSLFVCMMLVGLASCSGSKEEPFTGFDENTSTNTRQTDVEYPFYYFKGEKIGIELSDTKSYVLFREKDKEVLLNNLSERGVVFYEQHIRPFLQTQVSKKGDGYDKYIDCLWLEVDLNYKELNELPEVIYASPFVKASENGEWFPMTNCCYLGYYGGMDNLIKLLSTYKVEVLGELFYFDNIYAIFCTKESIGHALEVANILYESGIFYFTEPDFLSLTLD